MSRFERAVAELMGAECAVACASGSAAVHSALAEEHVQIGPRTSVWDHAHLRRGAVIGADCIVGGKSYLANSVRVGDRCKINAMVYLCSEVTLGDGVFIAAHTTFTNDFYPQACVNDLSALRPSEVDEHTTFTTVQDGVSIGAAATVGSDLVVGRFAVIGMGAVVTRTVPAYTLVLGAPALRVALVCRCGRPITPLDAEPPSDGEYTCAPCGLTYGVRGGAWCTTRSATSRRCCCIRAVPAWSCRSPGEPIPDQAR